MTTLNEMIDEYQDFCLKQKLPLLSADELLADLQVTDHASPEVMWLKNFIARWEAAEREEDAYSDL